MKKRKSEESTDSEILHLLIGIVGGGVITIFLQDIIEFFNALSEYCLTR